MGGSQHLWGKERVVAQLMHEQRSSGAVVPRLATFAPGSLAVTMRGAGFPVDVLSDLSARFPSKALSRFAAVVRDTGIDVVHSHGYKANIFARALRLKGALPGVRLVSTCHGWVETTAALRLYNALDRWSAALSDVTTVPDPAMLPAISKLARREHVANGVPDLESPAGAESGDWFRGSSEFVAGTLGRVSIEKGIGDVLAAASVARGSGILFTVAGAGELVDSVEQAGTNVRYAGYFTRPDAYIAQLDVYVQASHSEGLSLALLEAMRAGKPIVATDVGATRTAVTDRESALLIPPNEPARLLEALLKLKDDRELAGRLGAAARERFETTFRAAHQHRHFLHLYGLGA